MSNLETIVKIGELARQGMTRGEIAKRLNQSYECICRIVSSRAVPIEHGNKGKANYDADKLLSLVKEGYSVPEIQEKLGSIKERRIEQLMREIILEKDNKTLYELWKEAKQKRKNEERERQDLLGRMMQEVTQKAYENASWAEQRAFDYVSQRKVVHEDCYTFEELLTFFSAYEKFKRKNKKVSLKKLGKSMKVAGRRATDILSAVGLDNLAGRHYERKLTPNWKKEALRRFANQKSHVGAADVAYFLRIPANAAAGNLMRFGYDMCRGLRETELKIQTDRKKGMKDLTYRLASQVYEAVDCGFSVNETAYLLDTDTRVVVYALVERRDIRKEIVRALNILYPERKSKKPYL